MTRLPVELARELGVDAGAPALLEIRADHPHSHGFAGGRPNSSDTGAQLEALLADLLDPATRLPPVRSSDGRLRGVLHADEPFAILEGVDRWSLLRGEAGVVAPGTLWLRGSDDGSAVRLGPDLDTFAWLDSHGLVVGRCAPSRPVALARPDVRRWMTPGGPEAWLGRALDALLATSDPWSWSVAAGLADRLWVPATAAAREALWERRVAGEPSPVRAGLIAWAGAHPSAAFDPVATRTLAEIDELAETLGRLRALAERDPVGARAVADDALIRRDDVASAARTLALAGLDRIVTSDVDALDRLAFVHETTLQTLVQGRHAERLLVVALVEPASWWGWFASAPLEDGDGPTA